MGGNPCNRPAHRLEERPGIGFQSTFVGQVFPAVTNDFLFHSRLWVTRVPFGSPLVSHLAVGTKRSGSYDPHCQVSTQRLRMGCRRHRVERLLTPYLTNVVSPGTGIEFQEMDSLSNIWKIRKIINKYISEKIAFIIFSMN